MGLLRFAALLSVALGVLAACERPSERRAHERELVGRALRGTLAYPGSVVRNYGAGQEAAELVLETAASPDTVARWYRDNLGSREWTVRREARGRDGSITLVAERSGRPLWIRLVPGADGSGTVYTLVGVQVAGDTIK